MAVGLHLRPGTGPRLFLDAKRTARKRPTHDLKGFYYQELRAHGIDYPRTTFERRYKVAALYLLNYAVIIAGTLDLGNERGQALARTLLDGSLASLDEMGAFDLL